MRLSLRTLLALEDNVFDVEQHRRLEQILPTDHNAEATLGRIRSVVRNPRLGVPGLVDHQEELDPNFVAEYLDHQMPADVQNQFEAYCLSADKYLAEIAAVHHVLANVLGEPARTSRECRLKCYDALSAKNKHPVEETKKFSFSDLPKHFRPFGPQESNTAKPGTKRYLAPLWNLLFPQKSGQDNTGQPVPAEQKSSLWTFASIGMLVCALLLGWQQIEKQRLAQQLRSMDETATSIMEHAVVDDSVGETNNIAYTDQQLDVAEQSMFAAPSDRLAPLKPIEQTSFTTEVSPPSSDTLDPFAAAAGIPPLAALDPFNGEMTGEKVSPDTTPTGGPPQIAAEKSESEKLPVETNNSIITFQPIAARQQADQLLAKGPTDNPIRSNLRQPIPATAWQSSDTPVTSAAPVLPSAHPQPIMQTSGTVPRVLGRALPVSQPSVIFSALTSGHPWLLPSLPFDLNGEQYLLTTTPFRGTFELTAGFRIEMIGDAKLCILPLDASGAPGIFVDYGRIIIQPLQPNQPLRIETEKSRGVVSVAGTNSLLFIDTFAEIADPSNGTKPPEEQRAKTSPILGFVPKNGERIVWKSISQPVPFYADSQGSILLQSDQYRFGEIRTLPNWLGTMPMSQEDRMLAEACRRCFVDARGEGEQALTWLIQNESRAVRTLGLRLWGDLGRFDVPLTVMAEKKKDDEAVRQVLVHYFNEVMRRDAETVQRFADAIEIIKEARKN